MAQSQNGYAANDMGRTASWTIPGTGRKVRLYSGDAGYLLVHFAAWFHKNIEPIDKGIFDDWGYAERPIRGSSTTLSNHASGTAIDLNATKHPLGVRGTFTSSKAKKIRAKLREYDGTIRWGGDYTNRPDEMHFEIVGSEERVARVADRLRQPAAKPAPARYTPGRYRFEKSSIQTFRTLNSTEPMTERTRGPVVRTIRQIRTNKHGQIRGRVRPLVGRWYRLDGGRATRLPN